jgi:hypothetical protein
LQLTLLLPLPCLLLISLTTVSNLQALTHRSRGHMVPLGNLEPHLDTASDILLRILYQPVFMPDNVLSMDMVVQQRRQLLIEMHTLMLSTVLLVTSYMRRTLDDLKTK